MLSNISSDLSGRDICHGKPGLKSGPLFLCAFSTRDVRNDEEGRLGLLLHFKPRKGTEYTEILPGEACLTYLVFLTRRSLDEGGWSLVFGVYPPWCLEFETWSLEPLGL